MSGEPFLLPLHLQRQGSSGKEGYYRYLHLILSKHKLGLLSGFSVTHDDTKHEHF